MVAVVDIGMLGNIAITELGKHQGQIFLYCTIISTCRVILSPLNFPVHAINTCMFPLAYKALG